MSPSRSSLPSRAVPEPGGCPGTTTAAALRGPPTSPPPGPTAASTASFCGPPRRCRLRQRPLGHLPPVAALGAQVRKGEKATTVVLWKETHPAHDDEEDAEDEGDRRRMFARAFSAFNLVQVEGHEPAPVARLPESVRLADAEVFVEALRIPTSEECFSTPTTGSTSTASSCHRSSPSRTRRRT